MDTNKLKELAEQCLSPAGGSSASECANLDALRRVAFQEAANPKAILGLIAEVERLKELGDGAVRCGYIVMDENEKLKEENESLKREVFRYQRLKAHNFEIIESLEDDLNARKL